MTVADAWRESSAHYRLMVITVAVAVLVLTLAVLWIGPKEPPSAQVAPSPAATPSGFNIHDWLYYWWQSPGTP